MTIEDITFALVDALEEAGCDYVLVGAIAAVHYGITRSTFDVDVVAEVEAGRAADIAKLLGPPFRLEPQQAFELFTAKPMFVVHIAGTPFKIDLFPLSDDPFDQERFRRRRKGRLRGRDVFFPTAEDVIVQKLRWGRSKDLDDARDVMAVQSEVLDWAYIQRWCESHGTGEMLAQLRNQIPPIC
jgi:hypothetical protein